MGEETFFKRHGTTDFGKDYEDRIIAHLILKLIKDDKVINFKLSSNHDDFGAFDDVVLEIEYEDRQDTFAMQLKHFSNKKTLALSSLQNETGNFSIKKYFNSAQQIKKDDYKLILFTNLDTGVADGTTIQLVNENFHIKISTGEIENNKFLNTSAKGDCYKFAISENNGCSVQREDYRKFLGRFFLYTKQANAETVKEEVMTEFQKEFRCEKMYAEKYLQFICDWSKQEGKKEKLDKRLMQRVIVLNILSPFIKPLSFGTVNDKMKLLREAVSSFDITLLKEENLSLISGIWGDQYRNLADNEEVKSLAKKYRLINHRENSSQMDDQMLTKLLWLRGRCPLIVTHNPVTFRAIQLCPRQKYIVLGHARPADFPGFSCFHNLSNLNSNPTLHESVTTAFTCSIQGKEKVDLKSLVQLNSAFEQILTTNELVKMLGEPCLIGEDKEIIPPPYITRLLSRNLISVNYYDHVEKNTLVLLDNTTQVDKIKRRLSNFNRIQIAGYLHENEVMDNVDNYSKIYEDSPDHTSLFHSSPVLARYVSGPDNYENVGQTSPADFDRLCNLVSSAEKCHQLRIVDGKTLEWIRSKSNISDLEQYRAEDLFVEEETLYNVQPDNNINLITGDPGMGKSNLLINIKNNIPQRLWSVLLQSKDITSLCEHLREKERSEQINEFIKFILEVKYEEYSDFDKQFIKLMIENRQVVYFWDALDEVSTQNLEIVIDLIPELTQRSSFQWVTSRSHLKRQLERRFNVLSRTIRQFDEDEQKFYIRQRLENLYSVKHIDEIIDKILTTVTLARHSDVLGIPLQIFMLTELFRQDQEKYFNLLQDVFSLTDLYHHIIEEKFNVYYQEKAHVREPNEALKQVLQGHKRSMFEKYEQAALKVSVTKQLLERFNINCDDFLKEIEDRQDSIGLITEVTDNFPQFLHNSYAEYFVATYFIEHHKEIPNFESILFDKKYANIRFFFDLMTAKGSSAHLAVINKNIELLKQYKDNLNDCEDKEGRNVLQLACSWGQRYSMLNVECDNEDYIIDNEDDESVIGESEEYVEMLQYLLENCDTSEFDKSSLSYAEQTNCLLPQLKLLKRQGGEVAKLKNDSVGINILYYSAKFGYDDVIDLFEELPFVKTKKDKSSLLHVAVRYNQEKFLRKLLSVGIYRQKINDVDHYGRTALLEACRKGSSGSIECLLASDADVNLASFKGNTPLHFASLYAYDDVVQVLLNSSANINAERDYGITPLHVACWNGNHTTVDLLLKSSVNINIQAEDGCSPLYVASRNNHNKVVELLLAAGAEPNLPERGGVSPLIIASQEGHEKNVRSLLKAGADVNLVTKNGVSPLYAACQNGHETVVEMLIQFGADVDWVAGNGWTPVRIACQQGNFAVIRILGGKGAKFHGGRKDGSTPLTVAERHGHENIVQYLRMKFSL